MIFIIFDVARYVCAHLVAGIHDGYLMLAALLRKAAISSPPFRRRLPEPFSPASFLPSEGRIVRMTLRIVDSLGGRIKSLRAGGY